MKTKTLLFAILGLSLCQITAAKDVFVNTARTTLMLTADNGQTPRIQYYGSRLRPEQAHEVHDAQGLNYDACARCAGAEL